MNAVLDAVPLVVVAASARALAECLRRAGLPAAGGRLLAVDAFGDDDLLAAVDGWQHLPLDELARPERLRHAIANVLQPPRGEQRDAAGPVSRQRADVLIGGGLDGARDALRAIGAEYRLLNTPLESWLAAREPLLFAQLGIDAPQTRAHPPPDPRGWLCKHADSSAGLGVTPAAAVALRVDGRHDTVAAYWQRRVGGTPVSLLFCAHAGGIVPVGINRQWCSPAPGLPFRFGGIAGGFDPGEGPRAALRLAAERVSAASGLRGLCSLDAVLDREGRMRALEVNPRPTASVELYDRAAPGLMALHTAAVLGAALPAWRPAATCRALAWVRAPLPLCTGDAPRACADWRRGAVLRVDDPLCTLHAEASDALTAMRRVRSAAAHLRRRLRCRAVGSAPAG